MSAKVKLKQLLRTKEVTDDTLEFARMFILPFARKYKVRGATVDDMLAQFFNINTRKLFYGVAKQPFKMPGSFLRAPRRGVKGYGPRDIPEGDRMLIIVDSVDQSVKIERLFLDPGPEFLLERYEFESIKDKLDVKETK